MLKTVIVHFLGIPGSATKTFAASGMLLVVVCIQGDIFSFLTLIGVTSQFEYTETGLIKIL